MPGARANSVVETARSRGLRPASLAALKAFQNALGRAIRAANGAGVRQNDGQSERSAAVLDVTGAPLCAFGDARVARLDRSFSRPSAASLAALKVRPVAARAKGTRLGPSCEHERKRCLRESAL
jgi:hypothetical protein